MAPWRDAGILLVGHGAAGTPAARDSVLAHIERIRALGLFAEAQAAFLKDEPPLEGALERFMSARVFVVPHFMSAGDLSRMLTPERLGLSGPIARSANRITIFCEPPGIDPELADLIRERASAVCAERGIEPAQARLLLVGHGSTKDTASADNLRRHAERLRRQGGFLEVAAAFLEEAPRLGEVVGRRQPSPSIVMGLFAAEGLHAGRDVRRLLAERDPPGNRLVYAGAIGADPGFLRFILRAVENAERGARREGAP